MDEYLRWRRRAAARLAARGSRQRLDAPSRRCAGCTDAASPRSHLHGPSQKAAFSTRAAVAHAALAYAPLGGLLGRSAWPVSRITALMKFKRRLLASDAAQALVAEGLSPLFARIYAARGIRSIAEIDHQLARLPPWSGLKGIDEAARRLADAVLAEERLLIIADYDADGAPACAVGVRGLSAMGAEVDFLVPNRFEFGYGLTPEIVALAAQREPAMIITVDNGIASVDGVAEARARGIEVLITDHHLPGAELPATALIVNPNQPGCTFPSKHLAGVGVMFYVLAAVRALLRERRRFAA